MSVVFPFNWGLISGNVTWLTFAKSPGFQILLVKSHLFAASQWKGRIEKVEAHYPKITVIIFHPEAWHDVLWEE